MVVDADEIALALDELEDDQSPPADAETIRDAILELTVVKNKKKERSPDFVGMVFPEDQIPENVEAPEEEDADEAKAPTA